jgi:hypothetical protein
MARRRIESNYYCRGFCIRPYPISCIRCPVSGYCCGFAVTLFCWRSGIVARIIFEAILLSLSFGLRSLRWRTDAKDMNMKMSVIQIVSLV